MYMVMYSVILTFSLPVVEASNLRVYTLNYFS